ncbi:MAG: inorganic phosphate transporter [Promethearchaeota archaeon]|nr:MAG: inorganic phosphate transporter [Candidatus Lokiarchaeota archaeon]
MALNAMVYILLILSMFLAFGIGANDETMATVVGSGSLKLRIALIIGGVLVLIGCMFLSSSVGKTIGAGLVGQEVNYDNRMMLAVLLSTTIWLIIASQTGAPISTTHSVVGSIFGVAIVWSFFPEQSFTASLNWGKMLEIVLGWVISPVLGFLMALLFQWLLELIMRKTKTNTGIIQVEKVEKVFMYILMASVFWTQLTRGGNDSANAVGIFFGLAETYAELEPFSYVYLGAAGLMIAFGLIVVGKNVIKSVGGGLVKMRPSDGVVIQLSSVLVLFLATLLGLPISGSHVLIFAILGAAYIKGERPDKKSFRKMVVSWIVTFPVAALLSAILYGMFLLF